MNKQLLYFLLFFIAIPQAQVSVLADFNGLPARLQDAAVVNNNLIFTGTNRNVWVSDGQ